MTTAIVKRDTVEHIVGYRNAIIQQFQIAKDAFKRADELMLKAAPGSHGIGAEYSPRNFHEKSFIADTDRKVWRHLMKMTQLLSLMDVTARDAFEKQLSENPPEVTVDNVIATLSNLMADADNIFRRSVVAVFESLPRSYRSNDGFKYGEKIIFEHMLRVDEWSWSFNGWWARDGQIVQDLDRIFHVLDNKEPPAFAAGTRQAIENACREKKPFDIETEYFRVKGFKKGTLHFWPLRQDLTEKANKMLAEHYGATVPDGRKAA